jgi:prepilin-type N-terminal cleavage/methylation domain-containing protein
MMHAAEEHGFTLVELLVAMALAMIVFGATLTAFDVFQTNNRFDILRNEAQDNARNAIDRLARELRNVAAPSTKEAGALELAEPYSITFQTISSEQGYSWENNTTHATRVRYCLDNSKPENEVLWRYSSRWKTAEAPAIPASPKCPATKGAWETEAQLVQHITNKNGGQNRPAFAYGPPGASEEASKITSVEPTLYLDVNPGQSRPGETQLTSGISLRNENRQPIAAFTVTQGGFAHSVHLNASESRDPDGLALTYKWTEGTEVAGKEEGGTIIPSTAQQYETLALAEGTHTFWLKVSDPGGLTASTKKTFSVK